MYGWKNDKKGGGRHGMEDLESDVALCGKNGQIKTGCRRHGF